jgi:SOS-response transcriptional repressor LexA
MPPAEQAGRPAKRIRTDAQLAHKRQTDKLKHKLNRAESKARLENIERDVSFLRETMRDALDEIRQHNATQRPVFGSSSCGPVPSENDASVAVSALSTECLAAMLIWKL